MATYGSLKSSTLNGVKIYSISGTRNTPGWVSEKKKRELRNNADYMKQIELIQNMEFNSASTRIKCTPDGQFIIASGVYPPQIKVFELSQLSQKFERNLDSEIIDFQILTSDYSKLAFLCVDRGIRLHAKFGSYFNIRIPKMGRKLAYDHWSCDLLASSSSPEIYRLNLEQGQFLAPFVTQSPSVNHIGRSPVHGLLACGGDDGALEFIDARKKNSAARINCSDTLGNSVDQITSLRFEDDESLQIAVGSNTGQIILYDLRSSKPLMSKDHMYGFPIIDIKWHSTLNQTNKKIISTDKKIVKIWDPLTGSNVTSVEPGEFDINDVCVIKKSGLILLAMEGRRIQNFFIPSFGVAPRWCSFLENLTEELEEAGESMVYDDLKFITKEDMDRLNLSHLLGTNLLRAYMHGYFINAKLYHKAKSLSEPFAYEEYRKQKIKEKLEAENLTRITMKRKLPKVNPELAEKMMKRKEKYEREEKGRKEKEGEKEKDKDKDKEDGKGKPKKEKKKTKQLPLMDDRFSALFTDQAFQVDTESFEYRSMYGGSNLIKSNKENKTVNLDDYEKIGASDDDDDDGDDDSDFDHGDEEDDIFKRQKLRNGVKKDQKRNYLKYEKLKKAK